MEADLLKEKMFVKLNWKTIYGLPICQVDKKDPIIVIPVLPFGTEEQNYTENDRIKVSLDELLMVTEEEFELVW